MTEPSDDSNDLTSLGLESPSPLRKIVTEVDELQREMLAVGVPERIVVQVIAHYLFDVLLYRPDSPEEAAGYQEDEEDEDFSDDGDEF